MAMDLSNQNYQPVNIGSGMTEAFKAGTGVYSDLASNVRALLQSGMGEEGAMRRTQVTERGANLRLQINEQGQDKRSRIAAGYGPQGNDPSMSAEEIANLQKNMLAGTVVKVQGPNGSQYQITGDKMTKEERAGAEAQKYVLAMQKNREAMGKTMSEEELYNAWWNLRKAFLEGKEPATEAPPPKSAGFMENLWGGLKGVGAGVGNVLGPSMAFAAGAGGPVQAGVNTVAGGRDDAALRKALMDRLAAMRGQ